MKITLIYGDGIGYEVIKATEEIIDSVTDKIEWEVMEAGAEISSKYNTPLPEETLESIRRNKIALKGPTATPSGKGFRSVNVEIRKKLDLYANLRPLKSYVGVDTLYNDIDLVIVRENTEGLYIGEEEMIDDETAVSKKIITKNASERIVDFAFKYAEKNNRKKVTAAHKANIMKFSDGLFLEASKTVAEKYPEKEYDSKIIDAMCMELVMKPHGFDVVVAPNFYGDILSDLCSGLVGGLGYAPGANIGDEYAVFEAVHGTAPDIAGKGLANPASAILSGCMMLEYIGMNEESETIMAAIKEVFADGGRMYKENGKLNTNKFKEEIIKKIKKIA